MLERSPRRSPRKVEKLILTPRKSPRISIVSPKKEVLTNGPINDDELNNVGEKVNEKVTIEKIREKAVEINERHILKIRLKEEKPKEERQGDISHEREKPPEPIVKRSCFGMELSDEDDEVGFFITLMKNGDKLFEKFLLPFKK